jgi:putative intracellular protease/amidase
MPARAALQPLRGRKALIVVTSNQRFGELRRKTGWWLEEVAHFHQYMKEAGIEVDFASPGGGRAPMDPKSDQSDELNDAFEQDAEAMRKLARTMPVSEVDPGDYAVVYFAGGHGTMWDFAEDPHIQRIAARVYEDGQVVAAVCHGLAALLEVRLASGERLIAGKPLTGFSNAEESLLGLSDDVPFLLEDELEARGATHEQAFFPFASHVVVSDRLVTGQNPASTDDTAKAVLELLSRIHQPK